MVSIDKNKTVEIIKDFGSNETDSGSADVQVAILTERIKNLTEHLMFLIKMVQSYKIEEHQ